MAFTEAAGHVKHVELASYDSPTSLTDISGALTSADINRNTDDLDISAFGDANKRHLPGLGDFSVALTGNASPEIIDQLSELAFTVPLVPVDFEIGPFGNDSGQTRYSGQCYILGFTLTGAVADKQGFTSTLVAAGDITADTYGAS